jgi:hypothetical protein
MRYNFSVASGGDFLVVEQVDQGGDGGHADDDHKDKSGDKRQVDAVFLVGLEVDFQRLREDVHFADHLVDAFHFTINYRLNNLLLQKSKKQRIPLK